MSVPITHLTLTDAVDAIRAREITALELTEACLARIEQLQPQLNCFISVDTEGALEQAKAADRRIASGQHDGPLHREHLDGLIREL